jgi:hypothetical protein
VGHAEAVLLVHHEKTQVAEGDVLREHPVGPDDHIHRARAQTLDHRLLLLGAAEAREQLHARGKRGEAVAEGMEVLLREHGGGNENGHLAAIGHRLEGGAQGDLGLAVAHVARHQPVHGPLALHVGLDFLDGAELIGRLLEAEGRLELALPGRVR